MFVYDAKNDTAVECDDAEVESQRALIPTYGDLQSLWDAVDHPEACRTADPIIPISSGVHPVSQWREAVAAFVLKLSDLKFGAGATPYIPVTFGCLTHGPVRIVFHEVVLGGHYQLLTRIDTYLTHYRE